MIIEHGSYFWNKRKPSVPFEPSQNDENFWDKFSPDYDFYQVVAREFRFSQHSDD